MLNNISLPAKFYDISNLTQSLKDPTIETLTFESVDNVGQWLFYQRQGQEDVLAVPADYRSFSGSMITILHRMFQGFEGHPENLRFKCIYNACHLQQIRSNQYKIISPGYLLLQGFQEPSLPLPQTYENLIQRRT